MTDPRQARRWTSGYAKSRFNVLTVVSLGVAAATNGRRSVHDFAAGTLVRPVTTTVV